MAKKKMKFDLPRALAVFGVSGVVMFLLGALLSILKMPLGEWFNLLQGVVGIAFVILAMNWRKGKESVAETLPIVLINSVLFGLIQKLPFTIPFFTYVIEFSWEGIALTLGSVWMAEAIINKFF